MAEETGGNNPGNIITKEFGVRGMSCTSCERSIESQALSVEGVKGCKADFARQKVIVSFDNDKTSLEEIKRKIEEKQYECSGACNVPAKQPTKKSSMLKPVVLTLALVAILFGGYQMAQGFAAFDLPVLGGPASLILLFGVGLLTGFHCVGMCGGFVMSYTAKNAADGRRGLNLSSHAQYGAGKLVSYTAIGALFGLIGTIFVFTPLLRGAASMVAGVFLVLFGVSMLGYIPALRKVRVPMPSSLSKLVYGSGESERRPLVTGLLNGLMIACGPLQALYIYAAGTGSVANGALALFAFGLGTLPVMFGFGMFASYVSKSMTQNILKASGIIVIVLGLIMLNRGLALTGTGYDAASIAATFGAQYVQAKEVSGAGAVVSGPGGFQEIRMNVTRNGWEPDTFVLKAGVPVKWLINGKEITSCNKAIQVPKLGLSFDIKQGEQVIEFTPPAEEGVVPWSCWMGMIQGTFIVKKDIDLGNQIQVQKEIQATAAAPKATGGSCGMNAGGSCGCGM